MLVDAPFCRPLGIIGQKLSEYDPENLKPLVKSQPQAESASESETDYVERS